MEIHPRRASATIHRFPPGGRAGSERKAAQADPIVPRAGSGWYHERAIEEARDEKAPPPRH